MHMTNVNFLFILFVITCSCGQNSANSVTDTSKNVSEEITSKHHNIKIRYTAPWQIIPKGIDRQDKVLLGLVDNNDHSSYTLRIAEDISKELLPDDQFYLNSKNQILQANNSNELLDEKDVSFHGENYHLQIFILHSKFGLLKLYYYSLRVEGYYYAVQVAFPVKESDANNAVIPEKLLFLDKNVSINGK
jgi:hypothetical protein